MPVHDLLSTLASSWTHRKEPSEELDSRLFRLVYHSVLVGTGDPGAMPGDERKGTGLQYEASFGHATFVDEIWKTICNPICNLVRSRNPR